MGKLKTKDLRKLLSCIKKNSHVIIPASPGYDSGVHEIGDSLLVVSTDPCIGVPEEWFGWLLVNYSASDVALFGAKPEFCTINLLGPPKTKPSVFLKVMKQVCHAVDELNMSIVTGHTGTYENLSALLGVCTAYGTINKHNLVTSGGAKAEDAIFCIKRLGLETNVNLALMNKSMSLKLFGSRRTRALSKLVPMQSCVNEALLLAKTEGVHAMHDATEGGLTAALNELADASSVGFELHFDEIPFTEETRILKEHFRLSDRQLLSMSSTGTILVAVDPEAENEVKNILRRNDIEATIFGHFTTNLERFLVKGSRRSQFPKNANDPYEMILSGKV